jgi:GTP-binding protein EngB required for normal cell division
MRLKGRPRPDLATRLGALDDALRFGNGRLAPDDLGLLQATSWRATERIGFGSHLTVVALAGATGGGKSSLFNALAGKDLATVGVRRPTTGRSEACVWGEGADALLDWLEVKRRHRQRKADEELDGLVLLDLPDHDSTEEAHRLEVDRLVELVDVFVWVLDPQKYADAALYERYVRPFASHAAVMVFALNHVDRLTADARAACLADLERRLEEQGLGTVHVIPTSARTGEGVDALRSIIVERTRAERAAVQRLEADLDLVARIVGQACATSLRNTSVDRSSRAEVAERLGEAMGIDHLVDAVARSYRRAARLAVGWPVTRWLARLRPDPLRRLHIGVGDETDALTLPAPDVAAAARAEAALRDVADASTRGLQDPWPSQARRATLGRKDEILDMIERSIARADLGTQQEPLWWGLGRFLQNLVTLAAVVGLVWLGVLFVFSYLQLPEPPTYAYRDIPLPTLLLIGGSLAGFLLGVIFGQVSRVGAARHAAAARRQLRSAVAATVDREVIEPLERELEAYAGLCDALDRMGSGSA